MRYEVAVVGGGSAGVAAALSATREGARTILIERGSALGGMPALSLVHSICGLYLLHGDGIARYANPGFPAMFAERLLARGGARGPVRMGRLLVLMHSPSAFTQLSHDLISEHASIELRLGTEITGIARHETGKISSLELASHRGLERIDADFVIDCSGDATVTRLLAQDHEKPSLERLQRPAYIFSLAGVDKDSASGDARLRIAAGIARAVRAGKLPPAALGAALREGVDEKEIFVTVDLEAPDFDPSDSRHCRSLEKSGGHLAGILSEFFRNHVTGFSRSRIGALPECLGIRESGRTTGQYRITGEDIENGATFDDAVALASWPMELRETATGPRFRFPRHDRPCEIPLRALRARTVSNLLCAGKCISSSHEAHAALRVIGTCMATGEAAGHAAARLAHGRSDICLPRRSESAEAPVP